MGYLSLTKHMRLPSECVQVGFEGDNELLVLLYLGGPIGDVVPLE